MVAQKYTNSVIRDTFKKEVIPEDITQKKINGTKFDTGNNLVKTISMRWAKNGIRTKPSKLN